MPTGVKLANVRISYNNGLFATTATLGLAGEVQFPPPTVIDAGVPVDASAANDASPSADGSQPSDGQQSSADAPLAAVLTFTPYDSPPFADITNNGIDTAAEQQITVTNIGTATATQINVFLNTAESPDFTLTTDECGTSLDPKATCIVGVTFGPAAVNSAIGEQNMTIVATYFDSVSNTAATGGLSGNVDQAVAEAASITSSFGGASGQLSGDGSEANPYLVTDGSSISIYVDYQNLGLGTATQFDTEISSPLNITRFQHNCDFTDLSNGSQCVDGYSITVEATDDGDNFDVFDTVTAEWSDPTGTFSSVNIAGLGTIFIQGVASPSITLSNTGLIGGQYVVQGSSFSFNFTLQNGANVSSEELNIENVSPADPGLSFPNFSACSVTSSTTSCSVTIGVSSNVALGNYSVEFVNLSGPISLDQFGGFDVIAPPKLIFVTSQYYDGNLGGFAGADALCNGDSLATPGDTFKALLVGNGAATVGTAYTVDGSTIVAVATDADHLADTLLSPIANNPVAVWTGAVNNCADFTSNDFGAFGEWGNSKATDPTWFDGGAYRCNNQLPLYCVQQ